MTEQFDFLFLKIFIQRVMESLKNVLAVSGGDWNGAKKENVFGNSEMLRTVVEEEGREILLLWAASVLELIWG